MSEQDDNFLSRWSRRKVLVRQGVEPPPAAVLPVAVVPSAAVAVRPSAVAADAMRAPGETDGQPEPAAPAVVKPPKLTLDDVEALTPESDFSRFIARDVDAKVKNSAMKKLFADPHYNVMDGLDTYIGDYNTPDPLPKAVLRQMVQARILGLLDDELPNQPAAETLAQAAAAPADVIAETKTDLQAQAEPAAEPDAEAWPDGPGSGAEHDRPPVALPGADADADAAGPVIAVPASAASGVHGVGAAAVAEGEAAQPGAGSSSRFS